VPEIIGAPLARVEIWEAGKIEGKRWRVTERELVIYFKPGDGSAYFLREHLPLTDKRALWIAVQMARAMGKSEVFWHCVGNRNTRYIEGVVVRTYEHE